MCNRFKQDILHVYRTNIVNLQRANTISYVISRFSTYMLLVINAFGTICFFVYAVVIMIRYACHYCLLQSPTKQNNSIIPNTIASNSIVISDEQICQMSTCWSRHLVITNDLRQKLYINLHSFQFAFMTCNRDCPHTWIILSLAWRLQRQYTNSIV